MKKLRVFISKLYQTLTESLLLVSLLHSSKSWHVFWWWLWISQEIFEFFQHVKECHCEIPIYFDYISVFQITYDKSPLSFTWLRQTSSIGKMYKSEHMQPRLLHFLVSSFFCVLLSHGVMIALIVDEYCLPCQPWILRRRLGFAPPSSSPRLGSAPLSSSPTYQWIAQPIHRKVKRICRRSWRCATAAGGAGWLGGPRPAGCLRS